MLGIIAICTDPKQRDQCQCRVQVPILSTLCCHQECEE